jgi:succinyl-CoA synthetase alpha subunit
MVQGITGQTGAFHTPLMVEYGTNVVAGVTPGKGGTAFDGIPVFDTVSQAVRETGANASVLFVPSGFAADAVLEAIDAGVEVMVLITEGIPPLDMVKVKRAMEGNTCRMVGPNCPGVITPEECKMGIMPGPIHTAGSIGVISRSGTLTYEAVDQLTKLGLGQSTCLGIGGDPIIGTTFVDALKLFKEDHDTRAVVMIGEIGGTDEEVAAEYISKEFDKPVVAFIAGKTAPPGKRMGHAGAIIAGGKGTAQEKIDALEKAGVRVSPTPAEIGTTMKNLLEAHNLL